MINNLYIKKNIKKNISSYINIILIITVSITIMNILNIYMDSVIYGSDQYGLEISKGYDLWLETTDEENIHYFNNIPNINYEYEDNMIYIKILKSSESTKVNNLIKTIIQDNKLNITVHSFSSILNGNSVPYEEILIINILKIIFILIGMISIYFIYTIHIENKKKDFGILISLGMTNQQLKKMLLVELILIFVISFLTALIISNLLMFMIINNFLMTDNRNLILIIYKFSLSNTIFLFIVSAGSVIIAYLMALYKIVNIPIINTIQNKYIDLNFNRNINIQNKSSAVRYVTKVNILRNKKHFLICSVITVSIISIIIVFFNLLNLLNTSREETDISVGINYGEIYNNTEMILKNVEKLENIDLNINIKYNTYYNNFLIENFKGYSHVSLRVISDQETELLNNDVNLENHVILSDDFKNHNISIGDVLNLQGHHDTIRLTVADFIEIPQKSNFIYIYVTEDNYTKITEKPVVPNEIHIYTNEETDITRLRDEINNIFSDDDLYNVIDNIQIREDMKLLYNGLQIMVTFVCTMIYSCAVILLSSFIIFYISNQKRRIKILQFLGAAKNDIIKITIYESLFKSIFNYIIGISLGSLISYLMIKMSGYDVLIDKQFYIIYGLILILTIITYVIPSYITVRRIQNDNTSNN